MNQQMQNKQKLKSIKTIHTVVWAIFSACIIATPIAAFTGNLITATWLIAIVTGEVLVLAYFQWQCPLTIVASRYTDDRSSNFDIYLPEWLARNNKIICGTLYLVGILLTIFMWIILNQ